MEKVFIALGSNLGKRREALRKSRKELQKIALSPLRCSHVCETIPLGGPEGQGNYLNQVVELATRLSPDDLLVYLKETERLLGRKKREHWAEREIDLDILYYGDRTIRTDSLEIPHPEIFRRAFVLALLDNLQRGFCDPVSGQNAVESLLELEQMEAVGALA